MQYKMASIHFLQCQTTRYHNPVYMTYNRFCNQGNTTSDTCGAGTSA